MKTKSECKLRFPSASHNINVHFIILSALCYGHTGYMHVSSSTLKSVNPANRKVPHFLTGDSFQMQNCFLYIKMT